MADEDLEDPNEDSEEQVEMIEPKVVNKKVEMDTENVKSVLDEKSDSQVKAMQ